MDCLAQGEPRPLMRWEKLESASIGQQQQQPAGARFRTDAKNQLAANAGSKCFACSEPIIELANGLWTPRVASEIDVRKIVGKLS